MKSPQFVQLHHENQAAVRDELTRGLLDPRAHVSPKFLYDPLGSRLFEAITELPEYYPTRTEAAIMAAHRGEIAQAMPAGATLVDLGAGNCAKGQALFGLLQPRRYVAVDISVEFLRQALEQLQRRSPELEMVGVGMDFSQQLALPPEAGSSADGPRVLFYPGSSIGNYTPPQARSFLRQIHAACGPVAGSGLLIGVDLVKDAEELRAAYDDALGVTAAFNRNLLLNANRLADCDFRVADWDHVGRYNSAASRIEMHLQARTPVTVQWPGGSRHFAAGERIHTENSCKWTVAGFSGLLREAGFQAPRAWTDPAHRFAVMWAGA